MDKISVIIPCYNEETTVGAFYREMERVRTADFTGVDFEYIFVDDGSADRTLDLIKELRERDGKVRYISFSRNFGKEAAILAGLQAAVGNYVTLMDADLQDPPAMLRQMYDAIVVEGYDQVGTRRVTRKGEPILRSVFAVSFYKIINAISDVEMTDGARDYRLMKRCVVDAILSLPEKKRYSKGIFSFVGFKTKWLPYENVERVGGTSKWSFTGLMRYAIDGIVAFSTAPLALAYIFSFLFYLCSIVLVAFALPLESAALAVCAVCFFTSATVLLAIGILGKYIAQSAAEVRQRPLYIVRETEKEE